MASTSPLKILKDLEDSSTSMSGSISHSITKESSNSELHPEGLAETLPRRKSRPSSPEMSPESVLPPEQSTRPTDTKWSRQILLSIKIIIGVILLVVVLGSSVLSKLTLVSLTDRLRYVTVNSSDIASISSEAHSAAVTLYWYLQFVLIVPSLITFLRCLVVGVIGKTTKSFPWPTLKMAVVGIIGSLLEVLVMTIFVYLVLPELSPGVGILLLCGIFSFQMCVDVINTPHLLWCQNRNYNQLFAGCRRNGYNLLTSANQPKSKFEYVVRIAQIALENKLMKIIAVLIQVFSLIGFIVGWILGMQNYGQNLFIRATIGGPLCILVLSFIWSDWFQMKIVTPNKKNLEREDITARYKSCYINSAVRLIFYPFVSYLIFRYASVHKVDPWCLHGQCHIALKSDDLAVMIVQVVFTLLGYIIGWIACTMTLSQLSMALPLLLSTPVTVLWYYLSVHVPELAKAFPRFTPYEEQPFKDLDKYLPAILSLLWISELLAMGYFLLVKTNMILSEDTEMFLTPHYDGVFFEQHMILNRQTKKKMIYADLNHERERGETIQQKPRTIFVCSTMYRENETEMKQMLVSIYNLANHYFTQKSATGDNGTFDRYESHIFFDGAINGTQIQEFGLQLLSLLKETLNVELKWCKREKTPYGYRLSWDIGLGDMPFTVHFKDKSLVKPKKRWSQVMYMNYVLNYRIKEDDLDANDTFILTTDADIDFTPQSVDALLDMLACNHQVGAVCARTHPKGSGPVYWYQIFDYAIGHWFQKPAEHILGCVLCSPGCFSVYRCKALVDVLETYSTEVIGANEFLMKDMGEDRWLCTLLIKAGWRLEYCAISEDQTYCPTDFGEFFKQRRRWIPSTIANLAQLISEAVTITRKNNSVSILFILFQAIMVFSTAISPATVILVIASGLQSAYDLSSTVTLLVIILLIIVSVFYGIVCLYSSPQTQIDMAKVLTFCFAIVMSIVVVGILKEVVYDIYSGKHPQVLHPPNCTNSSDREAYEDCLKAAKYVQELARSLYQPGFQFPVSMTIVYIGAFALTFSVAALLHLQEWYCLLHCVWYLLALPSGYLLLLIYSAANLDSQSWGTREGSSGKDKGLLGWIDHIKRWFKLFLAGCLWCCRRELPSKGELREKIADQDSQQTREDTPSSSGDHTLSLLEAAIHVEHQTLDEDTKQWLVSLECENFEENFEEHGYVNKHFIAAMKPKDFEAIGINKRGFRLRLQNAAKKLPSLPIYTDVPTDVEEWLERLEISEYTKLFHEQGYRTSEDIENLKDLTEEDLKAMGVLKRAHLQRLRVGIDNLVKPTALELRIRHTETVIDNLQATILQNTNSEEADFWTDLILRKLKPVSVRFQGQVEDLKNSLRNLRNAALAVLFLINVVWILLLYTLSFPELEDFGLDSRGFQLLFLAVYGFIIIVQFITLIFHRIVTLIHFLGRIQPNQVTMNDNESLEIVKTYEVTRDSNKSA